MDGQYRNDTHRLLAKAGAVHRGHFQGTSGRHLDTYVNLDCVLASVPLMGILGKRLAGPHRGQNAVVHTVIGPAVGGIILAAAVANGFEVTNRPSGAIWADKYLGGLRIEREGFAEHITGRRVVVVEDVLTTGGTLRQLVTLVHELGGIIVGASVICNAGGVQSSDLGLSADIPFSSLVELEVASYAPEDCPMCQQGEPIATDIGHGQLFLYTHPDYPATQILRTLD